MTVPAPALPRAAPVLGVDFGTSNTAAAILEDGRPRRLAIEAGAETLPTAVFFPETGGAMRIGAAAAAALIAGEEGRYMRALKSVLGTALFHEPRRIGGARRTLADIVTAFLAELRARAAAEAGETFRQVLSGRPVRFHPDPDRDARALADLRGCYHAAGFEEVRFLAEPEAAALAAAPVAAPGDLSLILDIGGGTSDFSVFRRDGARTEILASHGIRLGGTDFDREISLAHVMPLLGMGGALRRSLGAGQLPVPVALYRDLADWASIPFLYARETERAVADLQAHAVEPGRIARLGRVIAEQLGHDLAFAVERGKIAANEGPGPALVGLEMIERGLEARITPGSLAAALSGPREMLRRGIYDTLTAAGTPPTRIGSVILVGGSGLMRMVVEEAQAICPGAALQRGAAFTAVVDGLALVGGGQEG
ncbi:Hsp70 family protein [Mangrovicoccus algicola]|uniref:Hsp70 family protein n=1 Tax=Mangrovicoccus algicola TaxID=2771008 RepID=A0A8J6YWY1_9RHOB|nr:Hsp70 family protein [Mangrovicoccus algicola]MBE3637326.1 Hsp70 family protein [Mangrovicoccus algicola]